MADVIQTIVDPSLEEVAVLGAIVAVRIALGYFMVLEMKNVQRNRDDASKE
ncbi:DUF1622 domain-containing protein [Chloroflexota bacterium]